MNQRVVDITNAIVRNLHQVIREYRVTEDELRKAIEFLTEVGQKQEFTLLSDVLRVSVLVTEVTHADEYDGLSTPHNVEGPLYRDGAPVLQSPARLCANDSTGDILFMYGRVLSSQTGEPLPNAVVEVWQANEEGFYENQDERQPDYNLRGRVLPDATGRYEFRTIVPGPYSIARGGPVGRLLEALGRHDMRPAHIHFRITCEGYKPLTTMLFVPGDPWLDSDAIGAVKPSLVMQFERHEAPEELQARDVDRPFYTCEFDFKLQPVKSTVRA
ncbi:MAG: 6-chlorohydroxyquinol-1,2-dioxygenase [Alicyclobacillaceae bacterium]|nr:6-chlorohydroxyquinol-1,2-dioxygenase [Alicyclobacillaceae bacterium]